jgi:hypothetical protein
MFIVTSFLLQFNITVLFDFDKKNCLPYIQDPYPHSFSKMHPDPDQHSPKKLDPDPHQVNADPKHR